MQDMISDLEVFIFGMAMMTIIANVFLLEILFARIVRYLRGGIDENFKP
jgi:hypothetical protein